jgi:hypothetical protein
MAYHYSSDTGFNIADVSQWYDGRNPFVDADMDSLEAALYLADHKLPELRPSEPPQQLRHHASLSDGYDYLTMLPAGAHVEVVYADLPLGEKRSAIDRLAGRAALIGYSTVPTVRALHEKGRTTGQIGAELMYSGRNSPAFIAASHAVHLDTLPDRMPDPLQAALCAVGQAVLTTGEATDYEGDQFKSADRVHRQLTTWYVLGRLGKVLYDEAFASAEQALRVQDTPQRIGLVVPPALNMATKNLKDLGAPARTIA